MPIFFVTCAAWVLFSLCVRICTVAAATTGDGHCLHVHCCCNPLHHLHTNTRAFCPGVQVDVGITFAAASVATRLSMEVFAINSSVRSPVKVLKLVSFRAGAIGDPYSSPSTLTTLSGSQGKQAQIGLGAILYDKRQYPRLLADDGSPAIPGLLSFTSKRTDVLQVDSKNGTLTLLKNHHSRVAVEAKTCSGVSATLNIFCNLNPTATGDADLGKPNMAPIDAAKVGDTFVIPVRVNTGGLALSFFRVNVNFDAKAFRVTNVQHTIGQRDGSVNFRWVRAAAATRVLLLGPSFAVNRTTVVQTMLCVYIQSTRFPVKSHGTRM